MRHGTQQQQPRRIRSNPTNNRGGGVNAGGQRRGFQNKNRVFDSNGPDVRIRGTAHQIVEKYTALAKDANSSGDRVLAESYLQYAEHYQRIINSWIEEFGEDPVEQGASNPYETFDVPPPAGSRSVVTSPVVEEDLGLPSSILGTANRVNKEQPELSEA